MNLTKALAAALARFRGPREVHATAPWASDEAAAAILTDPVFREAFAAALAEALSAFGTWYGDTWEADYLGPSFEPDESEDAATRRLAALFIDRLLAR